MARVVWSSGRVVGLPCSCDVCVAARKRPPYVRPAARTRWEKLVAELGREHPGDWEEAERRLVELLKDAGELPFNLGEWP